MAGCGCTGMGSMNTYNGPVPPGVPNPFTVMLHSYPTRYHGPIYTRPEFGLPWAERPNDFALDPSLLGLGAEEAMVQPMEPWKVVVGLGLAAAVIWTALKIADGAHVRA
jgi:hypothetical protein